ncbi:prepilin-type N-terminal cleavage/methylation domain-containing protein [Oceanospirillum maris]|uniref:prepilin-type N-terminal cleavage/methylation domain-containing protein n=1 Tax=Oceanospirillum maris TaxID=64977 RepID=UPI000413C2D1|nr:prepilin-type N-terminal cleavage/methylation domain-containing protein [Oceanospirillum maris]
MSQLFIKPVMLAMQKPQPPTKLLPPAERGFTLPELLISLVLGITLIGAILSAYLTTLQSSGDNNAQVELSHNLRASLDLILSDLKRAGGVERPLTLSTVLSQYADNPFMDNVSNLKLWQCNALHECHCVTYSYDRERDGNPYAGYNNHFGFKLDSRKRISSRRGPLAPSSGPHPGCDYHASNNQWEALTEDSIKITQFSVSYIDQDGDVIPQPKAISAPSGGTCSTGDHCIEARHLLVTISGTKDAFSLTITGKVRVRNDRYFKRL